MRAHPLRSCCILMRVGRKGMSPSCLHLVLQITVCTRLPTQSNWKNRHLCWLQQVSQCQPLPTQPLRYQLSMNYAYQPWERSLLSTPREIGTNKCAEQKEARQETQVIRQRPKIKHKRTRKNYEPDIYMFVEYTDRDVLCQRGGLANDHPGNGKYLRARDELQLSYTKAGKAEKTAISQRLVDQVHNWNGRFLRKDKLSQKWYEIHNQTARTKAGQALREEYTTEQRAAKRLKYSQS